MELNELFRLHWKKHYAHQIRQDQTILLGVSGGLDSTVLAYLLRANGLSFVMAHMNFQLRGEESLRDEEFVKQLASSLDVPILVKRVETKAFAAQNQLSVQEAARELRYNWFAEIIAGNSNQDLAQIPSFIATAHHGDDSVETLLMHFFRGTGIDGLKGIPPVQSEQKLIRPLLPFFRDQLGKFAQQHQIDFVTDSSNLLNDYTRNYFRNELIPSIQKVYPNVKENLLHNIDRFTEVAALYKQSVDMQISKLSEQKGTEIHIPVLKLGKLKALNSVVWELIKPFGYTSHQIKEVVKLMEASNGSSVASATHRIIRNRAWLIIAPLSTNDAQHIVIDEPTAIAFVNGQVQLAIVDKPLEISSGNGTEWLDAGKIQFPLILRRWKQGDYFYPLGMNKKKKLSKFFIDAKLSKTEKEKVWVLEMDQKIICILGYRVDHRFRYTDTSSKLLKIVYCK